MPVKKVVEYFKHPLPIISKDLGLLTLLDDFIEGHAHMASIVDMPVSEEMTVSTGGVVTTDNPAAPTGNSLGIITLEDLFEEMILMEITDEHDKYAEISVEEKIGKRNGFHVHETPPEWLTHYQLPPVDGAGVDEVT